MRLRQTHTWTAWILVALALGPGSVLAQRAQARVVNEATGGARPSAAAAISLKTLVEIASYPALQAPD